MSKKAKKLPIVDDLDNRSGILRDRKGKISPTLLRDIRGRYTEKRIRFISPADSVVIGLAILDVLEDIRDELKKDCS
jgi:hypothetical protein